jgi:hypothetical protein
MDFHRDSMRKTGAELTPGLATPLLEKWPIVKANWATNVKVAEQRLREDVKWKNNVLSGGATVVQIIPDKQVTNGQTELCADDKQAIDRDVLCGYPSALESSQDAAATFIAGRLAHVNWRNIGHLALPGELDPIAYVLLNLDVLKSGASPCEHYISHERPGHGRRWRW